MVVWYSRVHDGTLDLCKHGQQLRWHGAECDEYFKHQGEGEAEEAG